MVQTTSLYIHCVQTSHDYYVTIKGGTVKPWYNLPWCSNFLHCIDYSSPVFFIDYSMKKELDIGLLSTKCSKIIFLTENLLRSVLFTPIANAGAELAIFASQIFLKEWVILFGLRQSVWLPMRMPGTNQTSVYFDELAKFLGTKPSAVFPVVPYCST